MFDQTEFNRFVIGKDIIGFLKEPVTFKSGRVCQCYVNWRNATSDAYIMDKLTDHVIEFINAKGLKPDSIYGVPDGATILGAMVQYKWAKSRTDFGQGRYVLSMGRKTPKDHGDPKDRYFVGMPKGKTIIIEDTTTTGGSLLTTLDTLLECNVEIIAAIGLTDRNEMRDDGKTVGEALLEKGVPYYAMSNLRELLPDVCKKQNPDSEIIKSVETYFEKYGVEKIKLG